MDGTVDPSSARRADLILPNSLHLDRHAPSSRGGNGRGGGEPVQAQDEKRKYATGRQRAGRGCSSRIRKLCSALPSSSSLSAMARSVCIPNTAGCMGVVPRQ